MTPAMQAFAHFAGTCTRKNRYAVAFVDAWRGITLREVAWALSVSFTFTIAHAYSINDALGRGWPMPVRSYEWFHALAGAVFLVAFRFAEHPGLDPLPRWRRYAMALPCAGLLYWGLSYIATVASSEFHSFTMPGQGVLWTSAQVILLSGGAAVVYSSVMRSRRAQAAFDNAVLSRAAARRRVTQTRLAALQSQVDPVFLFSTLDLVETLYESDPVAAERALANLIHFLRTALPLVGQEDSTLEREAALARAYLEIARARMGSRLEWRIDVPGELAPATFPAMVLVPLVEYAIRHSLEPLPHGGRVGIRAARTGDRLRVALVHSGVDDDVRNVVLTSVREGLAGLYGDAVKLAFTSGGGETALTLDLPYEVPASQPLVPANPALPSAA